MGFILKGIDLETSSGPTQEAYIRIDNYRVNKVTSRLTYAISSWIDEESAQRFNREYFDEPRKNAIGLIAQEVVYYEEGDSEGQDVKIDNRYEVDLYKEEKVEIPIYEKVMKEEEVPYVSFDENGDEIEKIRTINVEKQEVVRVEEKIKQVIDNEILSNLAGYCYNHLKNELGKIFPVDNIEKS